METAGWPVEAPPARLQIPLGRRRHRWFTAPSGLLLFVCLFLPAVDGCGTPVVPIEMPYFWHPYVYGLAFAVAAFAATARWARTTTIVLRVLAWLTVTGGVLLMVESIMLGIVELTLGTILLAVIGARGHAERRSALTAIVVSVACTLWFGIWSGSSDAMCGVYISLTASIFLLAGSLLWLSEL
jgi:hypothetical protein